MTGHDHKLSPADQAKIVENWRNSEDVTDAFLDIYRDSRADSCAPWCIPSGLEDLLFYLSQHELIAVVHVIMNRLVDREELDRGIDIPTPP